MFREANENVAQRDNQDKRVAPTTSRPSGTPPGLRSNGCKRYRLQPISEWETNKQIVCLCTWTLTRVKRRNPTRQVLKANLCKSGFLH